MLISTISMHFLRRHCQYAVLLIEMVQSVILLDKPSRIRMINIEKTFHCYAYN